ncbi:MAG: ATP-dependent zinc metalloprotease FtsH, partial [Actinomycetota bacterium]|nr:ATP-dependent zinc metalloprotease FtsH [Actinomycetota bacterium]
MEELTTEPPASPTGPTAGTADDAGGRAPFIQRSKDDLRDWLLRRRRSRASKRKRAGRKSQIILAFTLLLLLGLYGYSLWGYLPPHPVGDEVTLDQLSALADQERIETATFLDEDSLVTGTYEAAPPPPPPLPEKEEKDDKQDKQGTKDRSDPDKGAAGDRARGVATPSPSASPSPSPTVDVAPPGEGSYWASYSGQGSITGDLVRLATGAGASVSVDRQESKQAVRVATTFLLPLMILANLFALLFSASRGGGSAIGEVTMFGTIGRGRYKKKSGLSVGFADVAGAEEAVAELKEVRDYLQNPKKYADVGAAPPKGVLLVGPPGCGKTLLAKAVAGEAGVPFFSVAGAEFVESLVGVGAARVRDLFARVRAVAPAILFIDELDAAGRRRGAGGGSGGSDEREQTLNQMLVEMDGFDVSQGIVVIAATNRPDILDPALLRPGRFDRHVTMDQPDQAGREEIFRLHARGKPIADTVDFSHLAKRTPGFSGADLASVINEAALLSLREQKPEIEIAELEEAVQRVLAGPKKKGRVLSDAEKERAAYHEGGHAVVSTALGRSEDVHRVSILARGRGLGLATMRRDTDAILLTRSELFGQIITAMGGIASESLFLGEVSTGAEQDLEHATEVARDMVGRFGMGSRRQRLLAKEVDEFLGNDVGLSQLSPQTHQDMEEEVDRLLR